MANSTVSYLKEKTYNLIKKPVYWIYLALFFAVAGFGFYNYTLIGGYSNISSCAALSILSLLFVVPILSIGNKLCVTRNTSLSKAIIKKWLEMMIVLCAGLLIYVPFAVIISQFGVFRFDLYFNCIINIFLAGMVLTAGGIFVNNIFNKRAVAYIVMYLTALIMLAIEMLLSSLYASDSILYDIFYSISITKYTFGLNAGIFDVTAAAFMICVTSLFLVLTVWVIKKRNCTVEVADKNSRVRIVCIVVLALVTLILSIIPNGTLNGIDMTPTHFYTASNTAKKFTEAVEEDISITVLDSKNGFVDKNNYSVYFVHAARVIEQLSDSSDNIVLKYDDSAELRETYSANEGDILISSGDNYELINSEELFNFSYPVDAEGNTYIQLTSSRVEEAICSGIKDVLTDDKEKIVFLTGYGEHENYKNLAAMMEKIGYQVEYADAHEDSIPSAKLVVIFAPSQDYYDTAVLEEYLYNDGQYGRNLLYVAQSDCDIVPTNLGNFLYKWGITVENYSIIESNIENCKNGNEMYGINEYIEYSFITDYTYLETPALVPYSRNIIVNTEDTNLSYRILLQSKDTSYLANRNTMIDEYNNYYTTIISSYYQTSAFGNTYTGAEGHVAVIGSEFAFDDAVLSDEEYSNNSYFNDVIRELMGENTASVKMSDRSMSLKAFEATDTACTIMGIVFIFTLPAAMVITAIFVKFKKPKSKNKNHKLRDIMNS